MDATASLGLRAEGTAKGREAGSGDVLLSGNSVAMEHPANLIERAEGWLIIAGAAERFCVNRC